VYSCSEKKIGAGFDMSDRTIPLSVSTQEKKKSLTTQHIITSLIWGLYLISDPALGWSQSKEGK
jgi:hypothetical protein